MIFKRKKSDEEELARDKLEHEAFLKSLPADIREAAKHTTNNRKELSKSDFAGCYYCLSIFKPALISEWITPKGLEEFPMCPYCGIDSIFGDASGYPVTRGFLQQMNKHWFGGDGKIIHSQMGNNT